MKSKIIFSLVAFLLAFGNFSIAQEDNTQSVKKAIVVKTILDEDGKEVTETIELEGDEVDQYMQQHANEPGAAKEIKIIKEQDGDNSNIWIQKDGEEIIINEGQDFIFSDENENQNVIKIKTIDGEGDHDIRVIRLSSDGEDMDFEGSENVDVEVTEENGRQIIKLKIDGKEKIIEIDDDEDGHQMKKRIMFMGDDEDGDHHQMRREMHMGNGGPFIGIKFMKKVSRTMEDGVEEETVESDGLVILETIDGSPAETAGLQMDDLILSIDGVGMENIEDLTNFMTKKKVGDVINTVVKRGDQELTIPVTLGERPQDKHHMNIRKHKFMRGMGDHHAPHHNTFFKRDPCKPLIGFYNNNQEESQVGVLVGKIIDNSPAQRKGLQPGDIILEMDKTPVKNWDELIAIRDQHEAGDRFKLLVDRNGKKIKVKANFNDCPKEEAVEEIIQLENPGEAPLNSQTEFRAFPNPSKGMVTIAYQGEPGAIDIKVNDISGRTIVEKTISDFDGNYSEEFDFSEVPEGTLIIQIDNGKDVRVEKLILQGGN